MVVLIDGEGAAGKAVLRSLLEGHPALSVLPVHDMLVDTLAGSVEQVPWLRYRDTAHLRGLLARTGYYQLEQVALRGEIEFDISVTDRVRIPYRLDFGRFDTSWLHRLVATPGWTPTVVLRTLHETYAEVWTGRPGPGAVPVGVGSDDPATPGRLFAAFPEARLLYLRRPVDSVLAARATRRPSRNDMMSELTLPGTTVESLLRRDKVGTIRRRLGTVERLAAARPDRVRIVDFEPLVEDTRATMAGIAEFLRIDPDPVLTRSTLAGHPLVGPSGAGYVGRILDRPESLLGPYERALIAFDADWRSILSPAGLQAPGAAAHAVRLRCGRGVRRARRGLAARLG